MYSDVELHDSELVSVEWDAQGNGIVHLDAYVHLYEASIEDPHDGGRQRIRFEVGTMTISGEIGELPAWIYEGSLKIGQSLFDNTVSFPAEHRGPGSLTMTLSDDARELGVIGNDIAIVPESEFRFIERVDSTGPAS
jgi:hypothetical protein